MDNPRLLQWLNANAHLLRTDPIYPGNGAPPRPGEARPGLSPFGRLAMGGNLGVSSNLIYDHRSDCTQVAPVDMINIEGDDVDACQLSVVLHPPRVIPLRFDDLRGLRLDTQNITGDQSNCEVSCDDFPGTDHSIRWPPLEAEIAFGVGGVGTKFIVDYVNGMTVSVIASFLRVRAVVTQNEHCGDIEGTSALYKLAAHVGPGFAECHAQRTVFVGDVDDGDESHIFDVPMFAKVAQLIGHRSRHRHHPKLTLGWIRFWQDPKGHHGAGDAFVSDHQYRVDVPNGAMYFSVHNESGHKMKLATVFELAL